MSYIQYFCLRGDTADRRFFGSPLEFGEAYSEMTSNGWPNVAWTPSGNTLVYGGHDSSIHFATFVGGTPM